MTRKVKNTTGLILTKSKSVSTKIGFESSLKASVSAGVEGLTENMVTTAQIKEEISSSLLGSEEENWSKVFKTRHTIPAWRNYRVWQLHLNFSSPIESDNCSLYCSERIEELLK